MECGNEEEMKFAYLLLGHRNADQILRLIRILGGEDTSFILHIDRKTKKSEYDKLRRGTRHLKNVLYARREKVYWGDFSVVKATLNSIQKLRKIDYDYAVLISGQHYPIKTITEIQNFFIRNKGKAFIESFMIPTSKKWADHEGGLERINCWYFRLGPNVYRFPYFLLESFHTLYHRIMGWGGALVRLLSHQSLHKLKKKELMLRQLLFRHSDLYPIRKKNRILRRRFLEGLTPYGGSQWWALPKEIVWFIDRFCKENPEFLRFYRYTLVPDEIFFQTIVMNSRFRDRVISDDLVYTRWDEIKKKHPHVLTRHDFGILTRSKKLFARKFHEKTDYEILNMLDRKLNSD